MARSQGGNNNTWCQDNALGWINWSNLEDNRDLFRFFCNLIAFRKHHDLLRPRHYEGEESCDRRLTWHGKSLNAPDWSDTSHSLAMHLQGQADEAEIYLIVHADKEAADFALPNSGKKAPWQRFIDTALAIELSSCTPGEEQEIDNQQRYHVQGHSVVVLVRGGR